ncbi:MAG: UDP-4-amino-4,6-dideoxy-N-acetyl-beta-L-altrosamine transaminase [Peptococcaceae bacterium]|nr:UDP-4-amino-4,6-dideoxy-N-acetyl-beta-L-altrosamine transaminase [Peptococcaceae bacterium]
MVSADVLAIAGGKPVRDTFLPYARQWVDEEDIQAVNEVLRSDWLTTGPKVPEFEERVAEYVGAKYAVAFSSGTAALHGACFAAGLARGDEAITTPMTFAASANCIRFMGALPVFADIDLKTYNIDPAEIAKNITGDTKVVIPVHYTGQSCDLDAIHKLAREHDLIVIEDAAHALGAAYKGRRIGALSDMTVFSFHPVKHITTGEGGMVVTDNQEYYEWLKLFRSHGIVRDRDEMVDYHGPWYYEVQDAGYNYRMTDFQAALGISQLKKLDRFLARRREIAARYNEAFKDMPEVEIPYQHPDGESAWHLYVLALNLDRLQVNRRFVYEALCAENIGVQVHYIPLHIHPYYKWLINSNPNICTFEDPSPAPRAEELYRRIISLPLFPAMSDRDVDDVIAAVRKVITRVRKK